MVCDRIVAEFLMIDAADCFDYCVLNVLQVPDTEEISRKIEENKTLPTVENKMFTKDSLSVTCFQRLFCLLFTLLSHSCAANRQIQNK